MKEKQYKITSTEKRHFANGDTVIAEFSDTKTGFRFRLRVNGKAGPWTDATIRIGSGSRCNPPREPNQPPHGHYESAAHATSKAGNHYALFSAYWSGSFPVEEPVQIVEGK